MLSISSNVAPSRGAFVKLSNFLALKLYPFLVSTLLVVELFIFAILFIVLPSSTLEKSVFIFTCSGSPYSICLISLVTFIVLVDLSIFTLKCLGACTSKILTLGSNLSVKFKYPLLKYP